ncbi:hypothetical protein, partial [Glutamicibacter sp.]|uniref:hypothetical protein n=1 Tax=Glutamicibacter sp. TaxID=1931995 RepID=UPI003D6B458B
CIHQIKIFGINKLGTLLSSQTTNTLDTTMTISEDHCFAPEQLYKLTTKLTVVNSTFQYRSPRLFRFALSGCPDQRREIKLYTGSARTQNRPVSILFCPESPESCGFPAVQGEYRLKTTENCCYEAGHLNENGP